MHIQSVIEQQFLYLARLQEVQGERPVLVQRPQGGDLNLEGKFWYEWRKVGTTAPLLTCSVLNNEIAFDPDLRDWQALKGEMEKFASFIETERIPSMLSWSGGKGVHLEIFFKKDIEIPAEVAESIRKYQVDVGRTVRTFLAHWILEQAKVSPEAIKLDWGKINWSSVSKGSMIRFFGSQRPTGGVKTLIKSMPDEQPTANTLPLIFPEHIEQWDISHLQDEILEVIESEIGKQKPEEHPPFVQWMNEQIDKARAKGRIKYTKENKGCVGLQKALKGSIPEGHRDEVATGIAYALRFWKKESKEKAVNVIKKWCTTCVPALDFVGRHIDRKIETIYRKQKAEYAPCVFFRKAGLCSGCKHVKVKSPSSDKTMEKKT